MGIDTLTLVSLIFAVVMVSLYAAVLFHEVGWQVKRDRELTQLRERVRKMRGLSL